MKPDTYFWKKLETQKDREAFCLSAGSTYNYVSKHILRKKGATRTPRKEILVGIVKASQGNVSLDEAIDFFLVSPVKQFAQEKQQEKVIY